MIPLSDSDRRPVNFPIVTVLLIVVNFIVFFIELIIGDAFVTRWSLIPANIMAGRDWVTLLTSIFLHAGWAHILGNMLFLWVFGPEVEDAMGPFRYLIFYLIGGIVANLAQIAIAPNSTIPGLGASGAIAAVMGIFLITYPRDRIKTVLFLGFFIQITMVPAILLIGLWFLIQVFSEVGAFASMANGGVAYMAHIGGFIFGALLGRLFETRRAPARRIG
jgi:membrane associated rhomboid family serine protease